MFDDFPHFLTADMTQLGGAAKITDSASGPPSSGTIEQVGIATLITVPLGIMTATYLVSSNGPFARMVGAVVDAMTGAPAIIAGLFVYLLWVVPHQENGKSGFAAALALAVMMLPIVTRAAQEVVAIVPGSLREAALALGAPEWRVLLRVVLPTARAGLMTAVILGIAGSPGRPRPVLFNAGGFRGLQLEPVLGPAGRPPSPDLREHLPTGAVANQSAWGASSCWSCWSSSCSSSPAASGHRARPAQLSSPGPRLRRTPPRSKHERRSTSRLPPSKPSPEEPFHDTSPDRCQPTMHRGRQRLRPVRGRPRTDRHGWTEWPLTWLSPPRARPCRSGAATRPGADTTSATAPTGATTTTPSAAGTSAPTTVGTGPAGSPTTSTPDRRSPRPEQSP